MRLIDADYVLRKMDITDLQPRTETEHYAFGFAKEILRNAPTIDAEPVKHGQRIDGWIFVEDELPKDSEKVLCLTVGNFYEILCKIIGGWRCPLTSQEFYTDFVRYWQPLPKLPERSDTNAERTL